MKNIGIGMVGAGSIAGVHLTAYRHIEEAGDIRVADTDEDARDRIGRQRGVSRVVADYRALLDDPGVDVIDVCLPHSLHAPVALAALRAGKPVICEKPIATTLEDADVMIETARTARAPLFVVQNHRFMPHHLRAKQMLDEGAIGRPFLATVRVIGCELGTMNDPLHWKGSWDRAGGGALIDTGMHAVYMLQHFFGPVRAVSATTRTLVVTAPGKADDTASVAFEFPGLLANLTITYAASAHPWQEFRDIYGTEGSLHLSDTTEPHLRLVRGEDDRPIPLEEVASMWHHSITANLRHFLSCLLHGTQPDVTAAEAKSALKTALAAYRSAREGRRITIEG